MDSANCTSIECLRSIPEEGMLAINNKLINELPSGGGGGVFGPVLGFGPAPDGDAIPDLPLELFRRGKFHQHLKGLVLGTMANEGLTTSHDSDMPEGFPDLARQIMPNASNETIQTIVAGYHPLQPEQLAWDWTTDAIFACNAYNLARAMPQKTKRYIMSIPPAAHGQDLSCMSPPPQSLSISFIP